jgi:hypothetical protein
VAGLRWLVIFLFWAALDLSGPLLLVPMEAFEESDDAAHRSPSRRRDRQPEARLSSPRAPEARQDAARRLRLVAAASVRPERGADSPRKLPPSDSAPDSASDDH